jgi:hypothetical protein
MLILTKRKKKTMGQWGRAYGDATVAASATELYRARYVTVA